MWIMLNDAFLSIVENDADKSGSTLMVRARVPGDLERAFNTKTGMMIEVHPGVQTTIVELPAAKRDYRYRVVLPRDFVADTIAGKINAIRYPDFKSTIKDNDRHNVMLSLWVKLKDWQTRIERPAAPIANDDGFADEAAQLGLYEPPQWWKAKPTSLLAGMTIKKDRPVAAYPGDRGAQLKPFHRRPKETMKLLNGQIEVVLTCGHSYLAYSKPSGKAWRKGVFCHRCRDEANAFPRIKITDERLDSIDAGGH